MKERPQRAVLTIATGQRVYLDMALNLARSFRWWHSRSDIQFFIATDLEVQLPPELAGIEIIRLNPGELGQGFSPKLHLDRLAPATQTLFVDADCLCYGNLDPVFAKFTGRAVSTVGRWLSAGEFFGDLASRCARFHVKALPHYVGAVYYVEPGDLAGQIFGLAREIETHYDEWGFIRLRNRPNEEPLISVGMAKFNQECLPDDKSVKWDAMNWKRVACDVLTGAVSVTGNDGQTASPRILHFNDSFASLPPYTVDSLKLKLAMRYRLPGLVVRPLAFLFVGFPHVLKMAFKEAFRPVFRQIFGVRRASSTRP